MPKIKVTLMLLPSPMRVRMAGTPSLVAGTLTNRLGWSIVLCSRRAEATVLSVSWAWAGETSRET